MKAIFVDERTPFEVAEITPPSGEIQKFDVLALFGPV